MTISANARDGLLLAALGLIVVGVVLFLGTAATIQLLVSAIIYALITLGLNVHWGYGGQFNFNVMGFLMLGGYAVVLTSYPLNMAFWHSDGPALLGRALVAAVIGAAIIIAASNAHRIGIKGRLRTILITLAWFVAYIVYRSQIDPAASYIEAKAGFVGGLGLPVEVSWLVGGAIAGGIAYLIGNVCLGLRTDYLAIATIGIAEIIRAFLKNMEWLTRGTLTVSPLPWPVPTALETGITDSTSALVVSRSLFLAVTVAVTAILFVLLQRAYGSAWGRMMRAIRDNNVAAESMGKNVKARQVELFVLGAVLMGIGGALMATYIQIYDPSSFQPINHTFIVWVMVIVGGAGNNLGALFGGVLIIIAWNMSAPLSLILFEWIDKVIQVVGLPGIPDVQSRALQMRVFILGLVIVLALRYAPRGLIPERIRKHETS
jgi:branched-chain amino acid transport system permease protein